MNLATLTKVLEKKMEEERLTNGHGKKVLTNGLKKEGVTKKEFRCEECGRNFPAKQNLGTHMRRYHKTEILVCPVPGCNKTYKHRLVLLRMIFVFSISIFVLRVENYISG